MTVPLRLLEGDGPKTAFVLGGGGNLGAIQVGMVRALVDRGFCPDVVVGCSVGALNAACLAADPTPDGVDRLEHVWKHLDGEAICPSGASYAWTRKQGAVRARGTYVMPVCCFAEVGQPNAQTPEPTHPLALRWR